MAARGRQLTLRPLLRGRGPSRDRRKRAKRDWSKAEFWRALARNGVRPMEGGLYFEDDDGRRFHAVYLRDPPRVARRATLAKIIRERTESQKESQVCLSRGDQ